MERRDLLKLISAASGYAFICNSALAWDKPAAATLPEQAGFSRQDIQLLNQIAETILPQTSTPGAAAAEAGNMMAIFVADCYTKAQQALFKQGMAKLDAFATAQFGAGFIKLAKASQHQCLAQLDAEANAYNQQHHTAWMVNQSPKDRDVDSQQALPHYFTLFKQLSLWSFFTSEIAANEVLRYVAIPGKYDGDLPYKPGDRAWATS